MTDEASDPHITGAKPIGPNVSKKRRERPSKHDLSDWKVTDDWPERVPVTDAEVNVFEMYFGDVLDELFGPEVENVKVRPKRERR